MEFSSTRHVIITGTEVSTNAENAVEAKLALKELKQKKKEYTLKRRVLATDAKAAKDAAERAEGTAAQNKKRGFFAAMGRMMRKAKAREPKRALQDLESELKDVDEIMLNIESCVIQIEGKLLQQG